MPMTLCSESNWTNRVGSSIHSWCLCRYEQLLLGVEVVNERKSKKKSEIVVEELRKRSRKGLEFAKTTILSQKIEHEQVRQALKYYVGYWDDFTHPGFFSIGCEAVGGDANAAVPVQAALALTAAAFDIHDDIIDGSCSKHGVPSVFGRFGKDITLLLGNAFIVCGFALLGESLGELSNEKRRDIFASLNSAWFEVGNAHALELDLRGRIEGVADQYMRVVKMKAASIEVDMRVGAVVGGGGDEDFDVLSRFGRILGILATLREEFIDMFEIEELNQRIQGKYFPVPIVYAMQDVDSRAVVGELVAKGRLTGEDIDILLDVVLESKSVEQLRKEMEALISESIQLVSNVNNEKVRSTLVNLTSAALEDL